MKRPPLDELVVLVIGDRCWGKGASIGEALQKAEKAAGCKQKAYLVYVAHPDTHVCDDGSTAWPEGAEQPREIHRVQPKAKKKARK